jgi:hypothetical protein
MPPVTRFTVPRNLWGKPVEELVPASTFDLLYEALRWYATSNVYDEDGVVMNGTFKDRGSFARGILANPGVVAARKTFKPEA